MQVLEPAALSNRSSHVSTAAHAGVAGMHVIRACHAGVGSRIFPGVVIADSLPLKRRLAQDVLPRLIMVSALAIYLVTLNHWLTLDNVSLAAKVAGWDWQPTVSKPALFLVTLPFRCLPANWVPLALNIGTALCAALVLGLLARSVSLLPQDRFPDQQMLANNPQSLLLGPSAWVPPLLAVLACGLQMTFWENAISASGEMLDLLFLAYIIRCLLEYRLEKRTSWLDCAALAVGVAMANNWEMVCLVPVLFIAALLKYFKFIEQDPHRTPGYVVVFPTRVLLRLGAFALAGLSLFLLLPLVQALSPGSPLNFWHALGAETDSYRSGMRLVYEQFLKNHRDAAALLVLISLPPVMVMSLRWRAFPIKDRTEFGFGPLLGALVLLSLHAGLLMLCLWATFDPFFSPRQIARNLGQSRSFLTLYYLTALSLGYYSGFLLLVSKASPIEGRRRWLWFLQKALLWIVPKGIYVLAAVAAVGLAAKNLPVIRVMNQQLLRQFGQLTVQSLPPEGAVVLSVDPVALFVLQATLASQGDSDRYVPVDLQSFGHLQYQKHLQQKFPQCWPGPRPQTLGALSLPATNTLTTGTEQLLTGLLEKNRGCYLHPASGLLFERFYLEPHGLVYEVKGYPTNALSPPPLPPAALTNNLAFWDGSIEAIMDPLQRLIASFEQPRSGWPKRLMDRAHLELPVPLQFKVMARWYAASVNSWGVTLQRNGSLSAAALCFQRAQALNGENLAARFNLQCNSSLVAGRKPPIALEVFPGRNRKLAEVVAQDGLVDDPSFCFQMGLVFNKIGLFRQACEEFERVIALVSGGISLSVKPGDGFNLRERSRGLLADIQAHPALQPLAPAVKNELAFLEADQWYSVWRTAQRQLRLNPNDIAGLINEGISFYQLGSPTNAIPPLSHALALTNLPLARYYRGLAYLALDKLDAAETDFLELRQSQPKDFRVYYSLGEISCHKKDTNAAIQYFQTALANSQTEAEQTKFIAARLKSLQNSR